MRSMLALFLALVPAAPMSAAGATGNENPPLFPMPKSELVIQVTEAGPSLLEIVQLYALISDQHVLLTSYDRERLSNVRVVLDRPVGVPPAEVQSFFEHVLAQNECLLFLLRERAPRLVTVVSTSNYGGRAPSMFPPSPLYVPIERADELRDHPALYVRTVLTTERLDVRQMANAMRAVLVGGGNPGSCELLMSLGSADALLIQGTGARVADLVSIMRIADAQTPEPAPQPQVRSGAPAPAPVAPVSSPPAPKVLGASYLSRVKSDIITIDVALQSYTITNEMKYPDSLEVLVKPDESGEKWLDMDQVPLDPWKQRYMYQPPRGGQSYRIYTLGADGQPGGTGKDRDIDQEMIKRGEI